MQINKLLSKLTGDKRRLFFLSPHFDDAALSCGSLMVELAKTRKLTVVNVFTKANSGPHTLSAKRFISISGYKYAKDLYKQRSMEDRNALLSIRVDKIVNLDLKDALFRKKRFPSKFGKVVPEINHLYPTYRWHVLKGEISKDDNSIQTLKIKLKNIIPKDSIVFAPYNLAGHVDHKIVRLAAEALFESNVLYSEFPYNTKIGNYGKTPQNFRRLEAKVDLDEKVSLMKFYKTQYNGLSQQKEILPHKEVLFVKQNI